MRDKPESVQEIGLSFSLLSSIWSKYDALCATKYHRCLVRGIWVAQYLWLGMMVHVRRIGVLLLAGGDLRGSEVLWLDLCF